MPASRQGSSSCKRYRQPCAVFSWLLMNRGDCRLYRRLPILQIEPYSHDAFHQIKKQPADAVRWRAVLCLFHSQFFA